MLKLLQSNLTVALSSVCSKQAKEIMLMYTIYIYIYVGYFEVNRDRDGLKIEKLNA